MSVPKSNFEGHFSTYVFRIYWFLAVLRAKKLLLNISTFIMQKNVFSSGEWSLQFLYKSEKYMKIHFLEVNNTKMIFGYDFFMFNPGLVP